MNTDKIYAERIASEYALKETTKIKQLKKLDYKAKAPANIFAYIFGIVATLIFGTGMCLAMGVIGNGTTIFTIIGVILGLIGMVCCSINYLIYKKIKKSSQNKYGSDILKLAQEIASEN